MTIHQNLISIIFSCLFLCNLSFAQDRNNEPLISFHDSLNDEYGYLNIKGDTIIQTGKYSICFTDTFFNHAIVLKPGYGFVAINRQEKVLYEIYPIDNGPDYPSEGLFRIIENHKIGFADALTGKIIIKPQFSCAFPFVNSMSKVSYDCRSIPEDGYHIWVSDEWFFIDKNGQKKSREK